MQSRLAQAGPSAQQASTKPSASSSPSSAIKPDRLFVGNLAPTVDEYTLLQVFSKFGKITKLDFMFHKTGALKGKPRGYAFVEFANKDDAHKAMTKLHERLLRGRKLVVTPANSAPITDLPLPNKRRHTETPKTTTLSLLKSRGRPQSASAQIAAMEAKLAAMAAHKPPDEDYVPGSSRILGSQSPLTSAPGTPGTPGTPGAPANDHLATEEQAISKQEAQKAADDLEREWKAEFAGSTAIPEPTVVAQAQPEDDNHTVKLDHGLPKKPTSVSPAPRRAPVDSTREQLIKRGLAGLPRKPVF